MELQRRKSLRGFASMSPERRREIQSKGGKAAHAQGAAHKWTSKEASAAAKVANANGNVHRLTSEEARAAGRKGGLALAAKRRAANAMPTTISPTI